MICMKSMCLSIVEKKKKKMCFDFYRPRQRVIIVDNIGPVNG